MMKDSIAVRREAAWPAAWHSIRDGAAAVAAAIPRPSAFHATVGVIVLLITFAVQRFDVPVALALVVAIAAVVPLVLWPELATMLMVFLLYTNIPAVAAQEHGVPRAVAGAFILLLALPLARLTVARGERLRVDRTFIGMIFFLGVLLFATLRAKGLEFAADRIVTYLVEGMVLYWLLINVVRSLQSLRRVLWTILAAGALLAALTSYQEVTGSFHQQFGGLAHRNAEFIAVEAGLLADPEDPEVRAQVAEALQRTGGERSSRAEGPMDEPNRFAQILLVLLPVAGYAFRTSRGRAARAAAVVLGGLVLGGIVLSYSRGALVALGLLFAAAVWMKWFRPSRLLVAGILLLPLIPIAAPRLHERLISIAGTASLVSGARPVEADGAIAGRATEMLAAVQAFADHPLLGVGPGQYRPFYSEEYHRKNPRLSFKDITGTRRAHSLYIELAAELGVVGLAVFLGIVLLAMRDLARIRRRAADPHHADLATALLLALVAYLTTAVFLHMAYERYFWFVMALAGAGIQVLRTLPATAPASRER